MYNVSVLLLNYNGKSFNKDCIVSLLKQTYKNFEIVFIDNGSVDGSVKDVEEKFSKEIKSGVIKIVKNEENLWFAGGNNSGIPYVSNDSEYVWLLNNDTVIDENCLFEMVKGIESDEELGAVSSIILDKGVEEKINQKTVDGEVRVMNAFGLQIWEKGEEKNNILYTNFLCGCSLLYKKSLIEEPFLEFYKCYAEDMQLSRELILKGYKLGICKNAIVNHFGSGTMNKNPKYMQLYYDNRNLLINYWSFFSKKTRIKLFIPFILFHTLQLIANVSYFRVLFKAKFNGLLRILKNREKVDMVRKRINNGKILSENEFLSSMTHKMADDGFYSSQNKKRIARILNLFNKTYYKVLHIPSR